MSNIWSFETLEMYACVMRQKSLRHCAFKLPNLLSSAFKRSKASRLYNIFGSTIAQCMWCELPATGCRRRQQTALCFSKVERGAPRAAEGPRNAIGRGKRVKPTLGYSALILSETSDIGGPGREVESRPRTHPGVRGWARISRGIQP